MDVCRLAYMLVFFGGCARPQVGSWAEVATVSGARVDIERTLYVRPGAANPNGNCYVHVRVTSTSSTLQGIDLRSRWKTIYPECWGILQHPDDQVSIDCAHVVVERPNSSEEIRLRSDLVSHRLAEIPAGGIVDYYRDFNGNAAGRCDTSADGKIVSVTLGGELLVVGTRVEQVTPQRALTIPIPASWPAIPPAALVISE
jgi:hypothetical protein